MHKFILTLALLLLFWAQGEQPVTAQYTQNYSQVISNVYHMYTDNGYDSQLVKVTPHYSVYRFDRQGQELLVYFVEVDDKVEVRVYQG